MRNEFTAVIERDGDWVIAYCPEINEIRRYKIDRISDLKELKESYHIPKDFQVEKYISPNMFITYRNPPKVTVEFKKKVARWVQEINPAGRITKNGSYIVEIETNSINWLYSILMKYGQYAEIVKPVKIRKAYRELVERMIGIYSQ